jgi:cytoskeletal protein RodZ
VVGRQVLDVLVGVAVALLLTWLILIAALAIRRPKSKVVQLEAAYRQFSSGGVLPSRNRRLRLTQLVLAVLVILNVVWLGLLLSRASGVRAGQSSSSQSATSGGVSSSSGPSSASDPRSGSAEEQRTIEPEDLADSAKPFQTVRIQGTYRGGGDTFLRVQRWEGGKWLDFPLPTKTDESGRFTAYVELGQPGRYALRVRDPDSGVTSKILVLVIKG